MQPQIQTNPPGRRDIENLIHIDNFLESTHSSGSEYQEIVNFEGFIIERIRIHDL